MPVKNRGIVEAIYMGDKDRDGIKYHVFHSPTAGNIGVIPGDYKIGPNDVNKGFIVAADDGQPFKVIGRMISAEELRENAEDGSTRSGLPRILNAAATIELLTSIAQQAQAIDEERMKYAQILCCIIRDKFGPIRIPIKTLESLPQQINLNLHIDQQRGVIELRDNSQRIVIPN